MITDDYLYNYKATVRKVKDIYDGDTITVLIDLGMNTFTVARLRLYGIDAPEMRGSERPEGTATRDWLRETANRKRDTNQNLKRQKGKIWSLDSVGIR